MTQIQNKHILKCVPLLANILGDKYGIHVEISGDNAKTDGNTIYLPTLPQNCSEEFLGLLRGYLDHEAAHIRYSNFDMLSKHNLTDFERFVWNCIEDWRIEQKMAGHFEGCKANFRWLIYHVFVKDKKIRKTKTDEAISSWILLSMRSWDVEVLKNQVQILEKQINKECPRLLTELGLLLLEVRKQCESSEQALKHALAIVRCIDNYFKELERESSEEKDEQQNDREHGKGAKSASKASQEEQKDTASQNNKQKQCIENKMDEQSINKKTGITSQSSEPSNGMDTLSKSAKGQGVILASLRNLLDGNDLPLTSNEKVQNLIERGKGSTPEESIRMAMVGEKKIEALPANLKQEALRISIGLKSRLQGLLQAQSLVRQMPSTIGKINRNRLHALAVNDKRIFLQQHQKEATNTAVHILLDASGSMRNKMQMASMACFSVASALSSTKGINVGVTAFPASLKYCINPKHNKHVFVSPILKHGEKMHDNFQTEAEGGTPLTEALWWVFPQILKQKENRKIILIITDGEPDNKYSALHAIGCAQKLGIEIYGISLPLSSMDSILPNKSIAIKYLSDLPQAMFGLLQNTLVKNVQ